MFNMWSATRHNDPFETGEACVNHILANYARTTFTLALSCLMWIGCGGKKDEDQNLLASLPELPQTDVAKLKLVPNSHLLATSELHVVPDRRRVSANPTILCAVDDTILDFNVEVNYPVTVCSLIGGELEDGSGNVTQSRAPTYKLDGARLAPDPQSIVSKELHLTGDLANPVWWCRTDRGPWVGHLSSERQCTGSCDTYNKLILANAPNLVEWDWYGAITAYPSELQFAGLLEQLGRRDMGRCYAKNVAARKK
jgi:hypothetical protein